MSKPIPPPPEQRAAETLKAMLAQVSAIHINAIEFNPSAAEGAADLLAHIEIYGHAHTLLCKIKGGRQRAHPQDTINQLRLCAARLTGSITPLLIAPRLSPQEQTRCRECGVGYLDMEGNLRLVMDETFIVRRALRGRTPAEPLRSEPRPAAWYGFPPGSIGLTGQRLNAYPVAS